MREDVARAEARADRPEGPNYMLLYVGVGFAMAFLAAYTLTVSLTGEPEWVIPDSLSGALFRDMGTRIQPWVAGVIGGWIGYKVGRLPVRQDA